MANAMYIKLGLFFCLWVLVFPASANFSVSSFDGKKTLSNQKFLQAFPYGKYLDKTAFSDIGQLEKDRVYLQKSRGIGDDFLYYLAENFARLYQPKFSYMNKSIAIGEKFITYNSKKGYRNNEIYKMIGYFILGKCGSELEKYANNNYDNSKAEIDTFKLRLENNNIYISIKRSTFNKLIDNIKNGNIGYIFERFWQKIKSFFPADDVSKLTLKTIKDNIYNIYKEDQHIGQAVFLNRNKYKANYIAKPVNGKSIFNRYATRINKLNRLSKLVTSGGFSNTFQQPEGLTIDQGVIVNATLMPERHGLVIVEEKGGIRAVNLKRNDFTLPLSINVASRKLSPLKSLVDYSYLINWMKKNRATVFQTQLLAV